MDVQMRGKGCEIEEVVVQEKRNEDIYEKIRSFYEATSQGVGGFIHNHGCMGVPDASERLK